VTADPRLRLLGGAPTSLADSELLDALDRVRIVIRTSSEMTGAHTVALAAFVGMAARLFGEVAVEPPVELAANWWNAPNTTALLSALDFVRPHPTESASHELVVTFGDQVDGGHLGVGGDDYTVRLGRAPQPLGQTPTHAFGVHAAACLAISQLLVETLGPHGFPGVALDAPYVTNLVDYALTPAPEPLRVFVPEPVAEYLTLVVAGVGSVGTSTLVLLATVLASSTGTPLKIVTVDADVLDPTRNPFRYPALLGGETGNKAVYVAEKLNALGLDAQGQPKTVAQWARDRDQPGLDGLLLSSVDTLGGRLDVADVLARSTLSIGVAGLALHAQREAFADGFACPFCDYVDADPPLTQAGAHARTTGLSVNRVLALLQESARLTAADVDIAIAAGKLTADRRDALIGASISDLVRQAYAEIELRAPSRALHGEGTVALTAPQVSWFAGVLAAVEVVKQLRGLPVVDRRVDVDLSGLPPGLVRRRPADTTGRCLCRSGTRIRWYRELYGDGISMTGGSGVGVS
jgi:hypothetical protein